MLRPSQELNPSYGYLWWLNGQRFALASSPQATRREGPLIAAAPSDLVAMQGARDRKLYLVPSLGLVVSRLGDVGAAGGESFNDGFWRALMRAKR
ncbi:MAG TPA: hypothetical protein VM198_14070 [Longimicrobiales bacterium]|nr:hypothetical protein [Longimicrobiales bacterium]